MEDHEIEQAIKELLEISIKYFSAKQMRSHIEEVVYRIRNSFLQKMQLTTGVGMSDKESNERS
jgi:hypothetical protein